MLLTELAHVLIEHSNHQDHSSFEIVKYFVSKKSSNNFIDYLRTVLNHLLILYNVYKLY